MAAATSEDVGSQPGDGGGILLTEARVLQKHASITYT